MLLPQTSFKTKLLLLALAVSAFGFFQADSAYAEGTPQRICVTAYYSPLPDQEFYMRGSYEADQQLNGKGYNGASGKPVYPGMLAAPKSYAFGTKILIPGLGVGTVWDRGGAIIERSNCHRIDVWMGPGVEGLKRALQWGYRTFDEGQVFSADDSIAENLSFDSIPPVLSASTVARLKGQTVQNPNSLTQAPVDSAADTKALQGALGILGYYQGEADGKESAELAKAILEFQLKQKVIDSAQAHGAGNYGPKTRAALKEAIAAHNQEVAQREHELEEELAKLSVGLGKGSQGEAVMKLQQTLLELGYYVSEPNGAYDEALMDAVLKFQMERKVLQQDSDFGAGYFGQKTYKALVAILKEKIRQPQTQVTVAKAWPPEKAPLPHLSELALPSENPASKGLAFQFSPSTLIASASAEQLFQAADWSGQLETLPGSLPLLSELTLSNEHFASRQLTFQFSPSFLTPAVHPAHEPILNHELQMGDRGEEVKKLQVHLIGKGLLSADLATGYYGAMTEEAVKKLQLELGVISHFADPRAGSADSEMLAVLKI